MIINPLTFLFGRLVAQRSGVSDAEATRLGLVSSVIRPPAIGIVLASAIAQNEAPSRTSTQGDSFQLTASTDSESGISLAWNQIPGAESYNVIRNAHVIADGIDIPEYDDKDVKAGITYYYEVEALAKGTVFATSLSVIGRTKESVRGARAS